MHWLVKEKIKRLKSWDSKGFAPPIKMLLYPTNRCNISCVYCNNTYIRKIGRFNFDEELSPEELESIIKEGLELGIREWCIQGGGEPLMSKNLPKIIELIKSYHKKTLCLLVTNGTLFTEKVVKRFVELELDEINFSISSPVKKDDNELRGPDSFDRSTRSLLLFKKYKKILGENKPFIRINSILSARTFNLIPEFLRFCKRFGVDELVLNPLRLQSEVKDELNRGNPVLKSLILTEKMKKHVRKNIPKYNEMSRKLGVKLQINGIDELKEVKVANKKSSSSNKNRKKSLLNAYCFEPFLTVLIGPNGEVGWCCGSEYESSPLNIRNSSLKDVWRSSFIENIRKRMLEHKPLKNCFYCGFRDISKRLEEEAEDLILQKD